MTLFGYSPFIIERQGTNKINCHLPNKNQAASFCSYEWMIHGKTLKDNIEDSKYLKKEN